MMGFEIIDMVAIAAFFLAALAWHRAGKLQKAAKRARDEMESLRSHVTASNNILERKLEDLKNAMRRSSVPAGDKRFHADMTVAEALDLHPDAGAVMAKFHLGGCSSCSISDHHVLGPAAESYGVDVDQLLAALNSLLDGGPMPEPAPRGEKLLMVFDDQNR